MKAIAGMYQMSLFLLGLVVLIGVGGLFHFFTISETVTLPLVVQLGLLLFVVGRSKKRVQLKPLVVAVILGSCALWLSKNVELPLFKITNQNYAVILFVLAASTVLLRLLTRKSRKS